MKRILTVMVRETPVDIRVSNGGMVYCAEYRGFIHVSATLAGIKRTVKGL